MPAKVAITVNGEMKEVLEGTSVTEFLQAMGVDSRRVAVEHNHNILAKAEYAGCRLRSGDQLEIVHFVGGGSWKTH